MFRYRINGSLESCDFDQQSTLHRNFWIISAIQDGHFMHTVVLPPKIPPSLLHNRPVVSSKRSSSCDFSFFSNQSFLEILFDDDDGGNVYWIEGTGTQLLELGFTGIGTHGCDPPEFPGCDPGDDPPGMHGTGPGDDPPGIHGCGPDDPPGMHGCDPDDPLGMHGTKPGDDPPGINGP